MIPGFDSGVVGMKEGEKKTLELAPADAYGEFDEERKQVVPKSDLASFVAAGYELKVGEKLPTQFGEFEIIEILEEGAEGSESTTAE
jgi:peptidylprolyl isomerase